TGVRDAVASVSDRCRPARAAPARAAGVGGARRGLVAGGRLRQRVPVRGPPGRVAPGTRPRRTGPLRGHGLEGAVPGAAAPLRGRAANAPARAPRREGPV